VIFVDSSIWFAAVRKHDSGSARAKSVLKSGPPLYTRDCVLVETWLLLRSRLGKRVADQFWSGMRTGIATIEQILPADLEKAWAIGAAFPDQDFSITDLTSFAPTERLGMTIAASLDSDFSIYRYGPNRRRSFEVLN
jgi:uncharacterized protein